ncbi:hypothetical protein [Streptomyces fructofermentans]|nr:hypothetical protein [Streptomyces fructofermentans]
MRMSEAYAGAVAGLVPVVLFLIMVEVAGHRNRLRTLFGEMARPAALVRAMARRPARGDAQLRRAARAVEQLNSGVRNLAWVSAYLAVSAVTAVLLLDAEMRALRWLASADPGPAAADARFCLVVLGIAFFRVGLGPLLDLVNPVREGAEIILPALRSLHRLKASVQEADRDPGAPRP